MAVIMGAGVLGGLLTAAGVLGAYLQRPRPPAPLLEITSEATFVHFLQSLFLNFKGL